MIDKIVEIVLSKFLQPRTRKEKADDEVKEQLVYLHEALVNCHNTYQQYATERNDMTLANWREAVHDLAQALDRVGLALSSFAPEAFDYAYLQGEAINSNRIGKMELRTRVFARYGTGSKMPYESALFAAGANPEGMMEDKYTRSVGFVPDDWAGGFLCPCHGSTFDMAGRVYKNKPAPDNLEVPPHMYVSDTRLLIGEDKKA